MDSETGGPSASILTRRRALTAALVAGTGLVSACTSARSPKPAVPLVQTPGSVRGAGSAASADVYAHTGPGMMNPKWADDPLRIYVPNSLSDSVTEIDPVTHKVIRTFPVGGGPNHVTPSWDGSVLWVNNTSGNSLTPISPKTGKPGNPVPVGDPYNLYFTPDGQHAMVMAEERRHIDFRDPHTMRLEYPMRVPDPGVNHLDFTVDGRYALASCEFSGSVVWIDMTARKVVDRRTLGKSMHHPAMPPGPGYSMPQDVRLSADGTTFYVADMAANGVWLLSASDFKLITFIGTGLGTHGFEVARDSRRLFVSNRGEGSISVLDMTSNQIEAKWKIPGGGSPDMGGITPDGSVMWWGGRYNDVVYAMSTDNGRMLAKIPVESGPHGLCVFPQPGRYSLGHTGNFR